jgi:hypothetical protein
MNTALEQGETVVKEGAANHFKGAEAVGGKLYLTNRRLIFESHAFNVQTHTTVWPLTDIAAAKPRNTLGIVPNGMSVTLKNGGEERFVVNGRGDWMKALAGGQSGAPPA